jgi:hypothetical protein
MNDLLEEIVESLRNRASVAGGRLAWCRYVHVCVQLDKVC